MSRDSDPLLVGRIAGLWRYPVKSMGGEELSEAEVSWNGVAGDRRWAFVRSNAVGSGFPWLTIRERRDMSRYVPSLANAAKPETCRTMVKTPGGASLDVTDPALAEELCADGAQVIRQARGVFDTFPLSLITLQTIRRIGEISDIRLEAERFRPNLLVDAACDEPFAEDSWVGRELSFGSVRMRVDKRDGRCVVITIDPETGERSPSVLRAVVDHRQGCLGVYGTTVEPGSVALNDAVMLRAG